MKTYYIYLARLLSACCFCLVLAKANVWLDTISNTVLVFGYRSFILFAPIFLALTKRWITFFAFLSSTIGVSLWLDNQNLLGTILFSTGIAVGGYVLKYHAAKTPTGAANNRIAFNIGGILSGIVIAIPGDNNFLWLCFAMLMVTLMSILLSQEKNGLENNNDVNLKTNFSFSQLKTLRGIAWALIGVITGVKMVSVTSILPQYLLHYYGYLPNWYGWAISLNCFAVVLLQKPIMYLMQKMNLEQAAVSLLLSMAVIAVPSVFLCQTFAGTIFWVFLLTLLECAVSYLDVFSRQEGSLLIKEFSVGIGMAITVLFMRSFMPIYAALLIGILGIFTILLALRILRNNVFVDVKVSNNLAAIIK